jgi:SAM-dependent methyltransferase
MTAVPVNSLARLSQAERLLAEATVEELPEVSKLVGTAEAARVYAQRASLGTKSINHAQQIKLSAERVMADLVDEGQANGQIADHGGDRKSKSRLGLPTLKSLDITKEKLSEARAIRDTFTSAEIEQIVATANAADKEVSRDELLKVARKRRPQKDGPKYPQRSGHPAKYSTDIIAQIGELLHGYDPVLDPFAGAGGIHQLSNRTVGVELEPEWADQHPDTIPGDALALPFPDESFPAIATSPTYGNRMADNHDAKDGSHRATYRHMLGRDLSDSNSGGLQWGAEYRDFHERAWKEAVRVLQPDGRFVLNIKDHIRNGQWQDVAAWHINTIEGLGLHIVAIRPIVSSGNQFAANADKRVPAELVLAFDRGGRMS